MQPGVLQAAAADGAVGVGKGHVIEIAGQRVETDEERVVVRRGELVRRIVRVARDGTLDVAVERLERGRLVCVHVQFGDPLVIGRQVGSLTRLINDLLDVSRINRGLVELHPQPLDLQSIIQRAAETVRPLIDQRRHRLELILPDRPMRVMGDPTRLEQVVGNLLTNSAKYTDPGGEITAELGTDGPEHFIRVRDNVRLSGNQYLIRLRGQEIAKGELFSNQLLAMDAGTVSFRLDGSYQDEMYSNAENTSWARMPGRFLANARIGWADMEDKWRVNLEVQNLLDKYYYLSVSDITTSLGAVTGVPALPRTYQLSVERKF